MKLIRIQTGDQEKASETIDKFFVDTIDFLVEKRKADKSMFEIKTGEIAYQEAHVTDDRVTYLTYKDNVNSVDKIAACVLELRNDLNNITYSFFQNFDDFSE